MESAIPQHLVTERTEPVRMRDDWDPPSPAFSARFPVDVEQVVMAYYGLQYAGDRPAAADESAERLRRAAADADGPVHADVAVVEDAAGYTNEVAALYWLEPAAHDRWAAAHAEWTSPQRPADGVGYFLEVARPTVRDFETIFGGRRMEGVSVASDGIGGTIAEHGYWGSMRDRLPSSQTSPLEPAGSLQFETDGERIVVHPHDGMCLIRSGQDWRDTEGEARERWHEQIQPVLREGMA